MQDKFVGNSHDWAEKRIKELETKLHQAMGAMGYPVPGDIPEGDYHCGLCESKARRMIELEAHKVALLEVIRIMTAERE